VVEAYELAAEHLFVEKERRRDGLVLGRGSDAPVHGEMREVLDDLRGAHLVRMAQIVIADEPLDPAHVGLLGAAAHVS
jgi:hypothetical protein